MSQHNQLSNDKLEEVRAGVEALQQDIARKNIEEELQEREPGEVFTKREKAEIKNLVHEALIEFFQSFGLKSKNGIITTSLILSSIVGTGFAIKTIWGWFVVGVFSR